MKKTLKKIFFKITEGTFDKLGFERKKRNKLDISQNKNVLLHTFYTNLKMVGFTPQHIVDIGDNH